MIYKKYLIGRNVQWLCLHIVCFTFTLCMCYFHLYMFDVFREKKELSYNCAAGVHKQLFPVMCLLFNLGIEYYKLICKSDLFYTKRHLG